jgi:hypothetical protein
VGVLVPFPLELALALARLVELTVDAFPLTANVDVRNSVEARRDADSDCDVTVPLLF